MRDGPRAVGVASLAALAASQAALFISGAKPHLLPVAVEAPVAPLP